MLELPGKRKHTFVVTPRNIQTFASEIELVLRHGFGNIANQLFDCADLAIDVRSQRVVQAVMVAGASSPLPPIRSPAAAAEPALRLGIELMGKTPAESLGPEHRETASKLFS